MFLGLRDWGKEAAELCVSHDVPVAPGAEADAQARRFVAHIGKGPRAPCEGMPRTDRAVAAVAVAAEVDDAELLATILHVRGLRP
eukprot:1823706-Alexandrium_andersonii.AAC.1